MPTAAKLIAAILFAGFGYWAGLIYSAAGQVVSYGIIPRFAAVGAICGWLFIGAQVGQGFVAAISNGVRTMLAVVFWTTILNAAILMVTRSLDGYYRSPLAAFEGLFDLITAYGMAFLRLDVAMVLVLGAVAGGIITEWVGRRWS